MELARRIMLQRSTSEPTEISAEEQIWAMANILHKGTATEHLREDFYKVDPAHFDPIANFVKRTAGEPTPERLQWLHKAWEKALEEDPNLSHPLAPLVRAWIEEHTAKPIPRDYDRTHPGGILPQKSMASVRYPLYDATTEASTPFAKVPSAGQLLFPAFERKMHLPEYLPFQLVQGVDMTARRGVLPYPMRFFFEVGMSLSPKQRKGWYAKTLHDAAVDIGIINPDSDKESKKYLTAKKKEAIHSALVVLKEVLIPYHADPGGLGLWSPFYTQNTPTRLSKKDFLVRVRVELPPDDKGGVLVEKGIIRTLYQNIAQLNAYLAACVIFNRYGRNPDSALINPTEPDPNTPRLESGQYVNPTTKQPIFTSRGKPVMNLFAPETLAVAARVHRKEANRYPVLEEEEIMRAVYPHEPWKEDKQPQRWAEKAWQAFRDITKKGYIESKEKGSGLWLLPSGRHIALHHEIRESSKKSQGE